jgi:alkylation response protein AidB-like acyl-CoA dehydrogenase
MDFRLSEEQHLLRRSIREFAETEIRPHVREWD